MGNTQTTQSNKGVYWLVGIVGVVLLLGMFVMSSSLSSDIETTNKKITTLEQSIPATVDAKLAPLRTDLTSAVNELRDTAASIDTSVDTSAIDSKLDALCEETDGCDGWYDVRRTSVYTNRVLVELQDDANRDLFRAIEDLVEVDEKSDIRYSSIHRVGDVRATTERSSFGEDDLVTVDMVIEVNFYVDGTSDTQTKYFRVNATLSELQDGVGSSEVAIDSVEKVKSTFTFD